MDRAIRRFARGVAGAVIWTLGWTSIGCERRDVEVAQEAIAVDAGATSTAEPDKGPVVSLDGGRIEGPDLIQDAGPIQTDDCREPRQWAVDVITDEGVFPQSCEWFTTCGDTRFGVDCIVQDEERKNYQCLCRINGGPVSQFISSPACLGDAIKRQLEFMNLLCGWSLSRPNGAAGDAGAD